MLVVSHGKVHEDCDLATEGKRSTMEKRKVVVRDLA